MSCWTIQSGFNKGRSSKFRGGSRVRQTPEEGRRTYRPKRCENNRRDEDNSPKTINDKSHQSSSLKVRQLIYLFIYLFCRRSHNSTKSHYLALCYFWIFQKLKSVNSSWRSSYRVGLFTFAIMLLGKVEPPYPSGYGVNSSPSVLNWNHFEMRILNLGIFFIFLLIADFLSSSW